MTAIAACAQSNARDSFAGGDSTNTGDPDAAAFGTGAPTASDASTAKSDVFRGNPLCRVPTMGGCVPDDPYACSPAISDGGDASAPPVGACRVSISDASLLEPECSGQTTSPNGIDGAKCTSGGDCASGFDCVESDNGSFCRQYCCLGTCGGAAASGSATFCDVQTLVATRTIAPVCMPLKPCKLLTDGQCASTETCAVVNENGDTGCVARGLQQVGQACDDKHCDVGLTCLGQPGNRKCQRLCRVGGDPICAPQTCVTTSAFKDSSYGICQGS